MTLTAWSWRYNADTSTYTLEVGKPANHAGFVLDAEEVYPAVLLPASSSYGLVPFVNGRTELTIAQAGTVIHMFV